MHDFEWLCTTTLIQGTIAKSGAGTGCRAGASDVTVANKTHGKESRDAPAPGASGAYAPGATSSRRSLHAPAPGTAAPDFVHFGQFVNYDGESQIGHRKSNCSYFQRLIYCPMSRPQYSVS